MTEPYQKQRHNFLMFATDYTLFALGLGFINLNTVLPTFAVRLGVSPVVVGSLLTALSMCWTLPQLVAGNVVSRFERKKPFLVRLALISRPTVMLLALLIALTRARPGWLIVLAMYATFVLFLGTDGFVSVAWFDILGRAFPPERRAGYISLWQVGKSLLLLGASAVVGYVLSDRGPSFPYNYALLFALSGTCFLCSILALARLHENPPSEGETPTTLIAWRKFGRHILHLWREDRLLRLISLARASFTLSTMASAFYILYATNDLHIPTRLIGVFILAQTVGTLIASLVLGRVADLHGPQQAIRIGVILSITAPILALILTFAEGSLLAWLTRAYAWIYICIGLSENLIMLGYVNYVFDIAPPGQRAIYMGTFNTLATIGVLGPIIAGWLLSRTSYRVLFAVALCLGLIALGLAFRLPAVRGTSPSEITPDVRGESIRSTGG